MKTSTASPNPASAAAATEYNPGPKSVALFEEEQKYMTPGLQSIALFSKIAVARGKGSVIEAGAVIGPYTVVGERSRISPKAVLKNCILFRNVFVARNVHLSNCVIGDDGHIDEDITVYDAAVLNVRQ